MYPWVTHTHSHLGGECPHRCVYCYVDSPRWGRSKRYTGCVKLIEKEFLINYDRETLEKDGGKYPGVIFEEHMNDLFALGVQSVDVVRVIGHTDSWVENEYVFQTKNPARYTSEEWHWPRKIILGTTVETNRNIAGISEAPTPYDRISAMRRLPKSVKKFITIEPVLDFDVDILAGWIASVEPFFVNLGADSKWRGLPEPTVEKIMRLVSKLAEYGIELREKHNLKRLKP